MRRTNHDDQGGQHAQVVVDSMEAFDELPLVQASTSLHQALADGYHPSELEMLVRQGMAAKLNEDRVLVWNDPERKEEKL